MPQAIDSPEARDRYIVRSLFDEAITSSQLEGAATTREVATEMLRSGRPPRDKNERMILNTYRTMQRIRELRASSLTPAVVFDLHRLVTEGTLTNPDAAGRLRSDQEDIRGGDEIEGTVFHVPPPASQLGARLDALCALANGETPDFFIHPVIRAILLHFGLAYDHPFVDGNGRTARALFYWSMLRQGYELFEFISISQILLRAPVRYAEAFLHTETDDNDLTYFILHQAGVIREAVETLRAYVLRKTAELRTAEKRLHGLGGLNHRQQALLTHALREPATRYLIVAHQRSHNVTHQTARDDLFDLVQRGLLIVQREGWRYVFVAPTDLGQKLEQLAGPKPSPQRIARCRSGFHPCQSHRRETHSGGFGIRCGRDWYSLSRRHSNPGRSSPDQTGRQLDSTEWLRLRRRTIATKPQPARIAIQSGEVTVSSPITRTAVAASARRANAVGTKSRGQSRTAMTVAKRAARIRRNRFMPPKHAARAKSYRACITALRGL